MLVDLSPPKLASPYYDDAEAVVLRLEDLMSFATKLRLLIAVRVLEDRILRFAGWVSALGGIPSPARSSDSGVRVA